MPTNGPQFTANGNISPAVFIQIDSTPNDDQVLQAGANSPIIGVAGVETDQPPLSDLIATQLHAVAGEPVRVHGNTDITLLTIGAAVTAQQLLKSDASGRGIPVTLGGSTLQYYGAIALESSTVVGSQIKVQVVLGNIVG